MSRCLALLVAALLGACGAPAGPPTEDDDLLGPLEALPECEAPPTPASDGVRGLIVPSGTIVTAVTPQDPLVSVQAYVPMTPVQFELSYEDMDDIEILLTENEIYEAELLVSNGTHRNFLKATAACKQGSQLLAVVAPELDAEGLPAPAGRPTPPGP